MSGVNVVSIIKEILDKERCVPKESLATLLLKRGVAESTVRKKLGEYIQRAGLQVRWVGSQEWICLPGEAPDKGVELGVSSGVSHGVSGGVSSGVSSGVKLGVSSGSIGELVEKVRSRVVESLSRPGSAGAPAIRLLTEMVREVEMSIPCSVERIWSKGMRVYLSLLCISEDGSISPMTVDIDAPDLADIIRIVLEIIIKSVEKKEEIKLT